MPSTVFKINPPLLSKTDKDTQQKKFLDRLSRASKVVILSPHLDDAALSAGSLIAYLVLRGSRVEVISFFTTGSDLESALTNKLLFESGFGSSKDYFNERKKEDREALSFFGKVQIQNLDFIDAAWRRSRSMNALYPETTLGIYNENDATLKKEIEKYLRKCKFDNKTLVVAPLGCGEHVDHVIVRDACLESVADPVLFLDYPYSEITPYEDDFAEGKKFAKVAFGEPFYEMKAKAILKYKTQRKSLFRDHDVLNLSLETFFYRV